MESSPHAIAIALQNRTFSEATSLVAQDEWVKLFTPLLGSMGLFYLVVLKSVGSDSKSSIPRSRIFSWTVLWLVFSAFIHMYVELFFVFFRDVWMKNAMDVYGAADFRYDSPMEAGTAAMETITAFFDGPMCLLGGTVDELFSIDMKVHSQIVFLAYGFIHQTKWYHPIVLVVSTCQIYGLVWFALHPGFAMEKQVTSDPYLFWLIFVGMNLPWGIFPPILWAKSFVAICNAAPVAPALPSQKKKL